MTTVTTQPMRSQVSAADGTPLFIQDYVPAGADRRVLFMHGLGEHSGRYTHVANWWCARGYAVRTYDHRGHGRSGGARGHVHSELSLLEDVQQVLADWYAQHPSTTPPVLLGHSMGGLFAARFALEQRWPLSALILSSPALALRLNVFQQLLLRTLTTVAPTLALSSGLNARYLSHDPEVVRAYRSDPGVHTKINAQLLNAMLAAIACVQRDAHQLTLPTLLLVAGDDRLVDPARSRSFFDRLPAGVGTLHHYPALYHELFNEQNAEPVFHDLARWLDQHLRHA